MKQSPKKPHEGISNFIEKTYNILEDANNSHAISWLPSGASFVIKDVKKFEESILPTYFKHSNFSSFVRQVTNIYI